LNDFLAFLTFIPLYIIFGIKSLINCILKSIKKPKIDENTVEEAKEMITLNEKA
jgi:hypothetical protein